MVGLAAAVVRASVWIYGRACDFASGDRLPLVVGELAAHMAHVAQTLAD